MPRPNAVQPDLSITPSQPHAVDLHVGSRIRMRRKFLHMSQSDLADAIGLTFQQVQKYERGANRISSSMLYQAAVALKAPVSYFFDGFEEVSDFEQTSESEDAINRFLRTSEGLELAENFPRISRGGLRRKLLDLVRTLGSGED